MGSTVRHGFSTLNRLLGKKNKDSSLSKSTTNLSALDTTSQHNKIIPLPAASTNAPFEQTFRITICLPRDQLFVVRVGAKTKLSQLLETVCASKQLDASKFEFRHPDGSQTYDLGMTIGEVGLNEIRLADKTDKAYIKFNTDDIMRLRHLSRESLTSSSDFSKGSARQHSKTVSPYSSTNSLNSMDSATGLNHHRNHNNNNSMQQQQHNGRNGGNTMLLLQPPVAPQRKKRIAPRPPPVPTSQRGSVGTTAALESGVNGGLDAGIFKKPAVPLALPRKSFHVSTPNLNGGQQHNGNTKEYTLSVNNNNNNNNNNTGELAGNHTDAAALQLRRNGHNSNGDLNRSSIGADGGALQANRQTIAVSTPHLNRSRTSSECSEIRDGELPTPRKRTFISAAKKKAPAPPPRLTISADSTTIIEEVPTTPRITTPPNPQNITKVMLNVEQSATPDNVIEIDSRDLPSLSPTSPTASLDGPRSLDSKSTDATATSIGDPIGSSSSDEEETKIYNIQMGKPIVTGGGVVTSPPQTPSPCFASTPTTVDAPATPFSHPIQVINEPEPDASAAGSTVHHKSLTILRESSEPPTPRAESPLWTYPLPAPQNFADNSGSVTTSTTTATTATIITDDVPIKAVITERRPLDFANAFSSEQSSIVADETSAADEALSPPTANTSDAEDGYQGYSQKFSREALLESLERRRELFIEKEFQFLTNEDGDTSLHGHEDSGAIAAPETTLAASTEQRKAGVMAELADVLHNDRLDALIGGGNTDSGDGATVGCDESVLSNFKIQTYATNGVKDTEAEKQPLTPPSEPIVVNSPTHFTSHRVTTSNTPSRVNRSDSFHSTRPVYPSAAAANTSATHTNSYNANNNNSTTPINGLTPRSSSYLSLIGTQKFENRSFRSSQQLFDGISPVYRRSSSSELSIADAPSLQSLSVMKSILSNSRKNSVCNDGVVAVAEHTTPVQEPVADAKEPAVEPASERQPDATTVKSNITITQLNGPAELAADQQKKWRYQGPPSINMSTWGERPKSSISIKTDTDYKFGVTSPTPDATVVQLQPTSRLASARKDSVTLNAASPAATVAVVTIQTPTAANTNGHSATAAAKPNIDNDRVPIIRGVVPKVSTTFIGGHHSHTNAADATGNLNIRRPSYEISTYVAEKPSIGDTITTSTSSATMTLGRVPIPNRWSMSHAAASTAAENPSAAVTVKTFRVADPVGTAALLSSNGTKTNYAIAKDGSFDSGYKSMPPVYSEYNAKLAAAARTQEEDAQQAAPFSQFTLRKTGLKDKILADSTARNISATPTQQQQQQQQTMTTTTTVRLRASDGSGNVRPFSVPAFVVNNSNAVKTHTVGAQPTPPPPPPPAPAAVQVALRSQSETRRKTLPPPEAEPRDQLLDAIRSFSKNSLKKK